MFDAEGSFSARSSLMFRRTRTPGPRLATKQTTSGVETSGLLGNLHHFPAKPGAIQLDAFRRIYKLSLMGRSWYVREVGAARGVRMIHEIACPSENELYGELELAGKPILEPSH